MYNPALLGPLAQSVEQWIFNPLVEGSNPSRPTIVYRNPDPSVRVFLYPVAQFEPSISKSQVRQRSCMRRRSRRVILHGPPLFIETRTPAFGFFVSGGTIRTFDFKQSGSTAKLHEAAQPPSHPSRPTIVYRNPDPSVRVFLYPVAQFEPSVSKSQVRQRSCMRRRGRRVILHGPPLFIETRTPASGFFVSGDVI